MKLTRHPAKRNLAAPQTPSVKTCCDFCIK